MKKNYMIENKYNITYEIYQNKLLFVLKDVINAKTYEKSIETKSIIDESVSIYDIYKILGNCFERIDKNYAYMNEKNNDVDIILKLINEPNIFIEYKISFFDNKQNNIPPKFILENTSPEIKFQQCSLTIKKNYLESSFDPINDWDNDVHIYTEFQEHNQYIVSYKPIYFKKKTKEIYIPYYYYIDLAGIHIYWTSYHNDYLFLKNLSKIIGLKKLTMEYYPYSDLKQISSPSLEFLILGRIGCSQNMLRSIEGFEQNNNLKKILLYGFEENIEFVNYMNKLDENQIKHSLEEILFIDCWKIDLKNIIRYCSRKNIKLSVFYNY